MRGGRHLWESSETGAAFSHCVNCRMPLVELGTPWLVNKQFHRGECVLEYAVCQQCRDALTDSLSDESKAAVRAFLESEIDWEARISGFMSCADPADRLRSCVSCTTPADECDGYTVSAFFDDGGHLVTGPLPLLICRGCIDRAMAGLSAESLAVWQRFLATCFEGPPPADGAGGPGIF